MSSAKNERSSWRFKVAGDGVKFWSRTEGDWMSQRYVIGWEGATKALREVSGYPLKVALVSVVVVYFLQLGSGPGRKGWPTSSLSFLIFSCREQNSWSSWRFISNSWVNPRWELGVKEKQPFLWNVCSSCQCSSGRPAFYCPGILSIQMCSNPDWQPFYAAHAISLYPRGD